MFFSGNGQIFPNATNGVLLLLHDYTKNTTLRGSLNWKVSAGGVSLARGRFPLQAGESCVQWGHTMCLIGNVSPYPPASSQCIWYCRETVCLSISLSRLHSLHAAVCARVRAQRADRLITCHNVLLWSGATLNGRCNLLLFVCLSGGAPPIGHNDMWCGQRDTQAKVIHCCIYTQAGVAQVMMVHACGAVETVPSRNLYIHWGEGWKELCSLHICSSRRGVF